MPFLINIYIYAHIRMTHAYVLRAPVHAQLHKVHHYCPIKKGNSIFETVEL